ncbi:MAG: hypothetical protein GC206_00110 [Alphaproteobacteria bacterium]|nr:hypothetical protein [Alphaproteobacteria bacterium]
MTRALATPIRTAAAALAVSALLAGAGCQREESAETAGTESAETVGDDKHAAQADEALRALGGAASAEQRALYRGDFTASGDLEGVGDGEGAWQLQLSSEYAHFVRPGLQDELNRADQRQYRAQGMHVRAGPLAITVKAEACPLSNGETLPYSASVLFEGVSYQGCAASGISEGGGPTWAALLPQLIPAIDACLERAQNRPARVTLASVIADDQTGVRIREADGGRYGCSVGTGDGRVIAYDPLLDSDRLLGEGDPEFVRAPNEPPTSSRCRTVTEAMGGEGEVIGWLVRRSC